MENDEPRVLPQGSDGLSDYPAEHAFDSAVHTVTTALEVAVKAHEAEVRKLFQFKLWVLEAMRPFMEIREKEPTATMHIEGHSFPMTFGWRRFERLFRELEVEREAFLRGPF